MINTLKIKGRMAEKGLTNQKTSQRMNMCAYTFRRKIKNEVPMTLEEAENLAIILDITIEEFPESFLIKTLQNATKNNHNPIQK